MEEGLTISGKTVFDTLFIDWRIMVITATVSVILFIIGVYILLDKWGRGIPEGQTKPAGAWGALKMIVGNIFAEGIGHALEVLVLDVAFQRRTFRRRKLEWFMHIMIFWGWVGLFILTVAAAAAEFYGPFVKGTNYEFFVGFWESLEIPNDIFGAMLGVGITVAVFRRLFVRSKDVQARNADIDWILLIGLAVIVITGFYAQYLRVDVFQAGRELASAYPPGMENNPTVLFHEVFTLLFGVAYIPYSKYVHIFTAPLSILANHGGE